MRLAGWAGGTHTYSPTNTINHFSEGCQASAPSKGLLNSVASSARSPSLCYRIKTSPLRYCIDFFSHLLNSRRIIDGRQSIEMRVASEKVPRRSKGQQQPSVLDLQLSQKGLHFEVPKAFQLPLFINKVNFLSLNPLN